MNCPCSYCSQVVLLPVAFDAWVKDEVFIGKRVSLTNSVSFCNNAAKISLKSNQLLSFLC